MIKKINVFLSFLIVGNVIGRCKKIVSDKCYGYGLVPLSLILIIDIIKTRQMNDKKKWMHDQNGLE